MGGGVVKLRPQAAVGPQLNMQALNLLFERVTQRGSYCCRVTKEGGFNFNAPEWMVETLGQLGWAQPTVIGQRPSGYGSGCGAQQNWFDLETLCVSCQNIVQGGDVLGPRRLGARQVQPIAGAQRADGFKH